MQKKVLRFSLLLAMLFVGTLLFAQERTVSGVITSGETKEPLQGVTVAVKGTTRTTQTDEKGSFSIAVSGNESVLKISSVGFGYQEITVGPRTLLNVDLAKDNKQLDDVVIVGYGAQRKTHLTGAVETIKMSEVEDLPVSNLGTAIAGRILGLSVNGGTTRPGSTSSLTIRNPMTLSKDGGNLEPLYVIDGVIQIGANGLSDNTLFNNLDASEVESITILKDASAAVYGSRGANGVVLVQTKRGKAGAPRISYSGSYGWNDESYRTKMLSAYDFGRYFNIMNGPNGFNRSTANNIFSDDELEHFKNIDYDWLAAAWKPAMNMRHTLNVSGGANKATYFANASYYTQNGNLSSLDFKRWTFRAGADVNVAAGFKAGLQVAGNFSDRVKTFNKIGGENDENDYRNLLLTPRYLPMYVDGMPVRLPGTDALSGYHFYEIERLGNLARNRDQLLNVNLYTEYEAPFVKGLKARLSYGRNFNTGNGSQVGTRYNLYEFNRTGTNMHIYDAGATVNRTVSMNNGDRLYYSNENAQNQQLNFTTSYAKQIGEHNISALFSVERAESFSQRQDVWKEAPIASTNGQFTTAFGEIDGRTSGAESGSLGYIGRVNYAYSDRYLAEFLFRTDASTKFAPENYWGKFYSASVGWIISNEKFFNIPAINFLKVRYSAGLLGRDDTRAWLWRQRFTFQGGKGLVLGGNGAVTTGMKMEASPNRNATWSEEFKNNLGIDARFLRNRLSATIEGFYNKGYDMLIERTESLPITIGGTVAAENWGKIDFFGVELGLGWSDNIGKDIRYGVDLRTSWYDNKVIQGNFNEQEILYPWNARPGQSSDIGKWGYDYLGMFRSQEEITAYVTKNNITSVFGTAATDLKPGMLYYRDVRGPLQADGKFAAPDGKIDVNDQIQLTKRVSNPYGFGSTLRFGYKSFGFDAVITASWGGWSEIDGASRKKMNNDISRVYQSRPEFWKDIYDPQMNPAGRFPNPHWEDISLNPTSQFWQVSSFRMRMRNFNLNYTLPKSVTEALRITNARFNLTALNPIDFFNPYSYKSPEGSFDIFPNLRTFAVGVNVTF